MKNENNFEVSVNKSIPICNEKCPYFEISEVNLWSNDTRCATIYNCRNYEICYYVWNESKKANGGENCENHQERRS